MTFVVVDPAHADPLTSAFSDRTVHRATVSGEDQDSIASELAA